MNREQLQLGGRQGREDPRSVNASRAALGLRPLDGGTYYADLHRVTKDEPPETPESAMRKAHQFGWIAFAVTIIASGVAFALGANVHCPWA